MAVNKVIFGNVTLIDTSEVTVVPDALVVDKTALNACGELINGTNPYAKQETDAEVNEQADLLDQAIEALRGKVAGGGNSDGITPSGEIEITENGTYDVTEYASAVVNVVSSGGGATDNRDQYQRVEYIESDGVAYIITDFFADNSSGMEVIASFPVMQDRIPMGSRENSDATRFYVAYPLSTSSVYYGFNTGSSISCTTKVNTIYRLQTNFMNSRLVNVYEEDGTRKISASISGTLVPQTVPVSIFGYHSAASGSVTSKRAYKLYSARCSRGHEIVREYIPCYRKSDGVIGVYEKFTGEFLSNMHADGVLTKGTDIDWEV